MKDNSGKILLAMLAGASAGVIAGLMMAPDTGEATRLSVKKWAGKVSKDLEKNLQTGLEEIKNMSGDTFGKATGGSNASSGSSSAGTSGGGSHTSSTGSTGGTSSTGGGAGSTGGGRTTGGAGSTGGNA